jgi:uncharacterized protein YjbJ (UPF0337 family)
MTTEDGFLDKAKGVAGEVVEKAKPAIDKAGHVAGDLVDKAKPAIDTAVDKAKPALETAVEKAKPAIETAVEKAGGLLEKVKGALNKPDDGQDGSMDGGAVGV